MGSKAPSVSGDALDETDRRIVLETQSGLPLDPRPYHVLAERLGLPAQVVMARLERLLAIGVIRRIAAVPNHYALGYRNNAMTVWDVPDEWVSEAGREVGQTAFVSHCYRRPRHLPRWPYNLFAMVHGRTREEVLEQVALIGELLGTRARGHDVLFSTAILKKSGLRLRGAPPARSQ